MAGKYKESSLLFSANISSPFDEISAPAILIPPATLKEEVNDTKTSVVSNLTLSLQPHLEVKHSESNFCAIDNPKQPPSDIKLLDTRNFSCPPPPLSVTPPGNNLVGSLSKPPSAGAFPGSSLLRRPTSKYVVPPEINTASFINPKPSVFPPQPAPSLISAFNPILNSSFNHDSYFPTTDKKFDEPEDSAVINSFSSTLPSANFVSQSSTSAVIPASFNTMAENPPVHGELYHPVIPHWFYSEGKPKIWKPFSFTDSLNLEEAYRQGSTEKVATDGGRYDVFIIERHRIPIYWEGDGGAVMRCSWFRRSYSETFPVPYSEEISERLEAEYKDAMLTGEWHRQLELPGGERVMINSPVSMHHYQIQEPLEMPNITAISDSQYPQTVRRGADDFVIKEGAAENVDHLLFLIHGIGSACDLSFRSVEECVDDFRAMGEELLATHFKESIEAGRVGRVEILPISWHKALHGDSTGLDEKLKCITLRSIPKFREFTNDTLLDILFYTSPVYCQHIMDTVASEMDRLLSLFRVRHHKFEGTVSVGGHSLGSVILFDLLMHQKPLLSATQSHSNEAILSSKDGNVKESANPSSEGNSIDSEVYHHNSLRSRVDFEIGVAGTGQPVIIYPQLSFEPDAFFLMGSPVGMFVTVRGIDTLGPSFKLPTCNRIFNIFHPFDPVAYRMESLIDTSFAELRPVLIPHHKGRKRMHLELKDTIERVGSDIKNKIVDSIQSTWNKFYQLYSGSTDQSVRAEVDQVFEKQMEIMNQESEMEQAQHVEVGQLNRGFRIDYVLQEKPYESFTEYIFALQAHLTYWNSEDTLLMILRELYKIKDIQCDSFGKRKSQTEPPTPTISTSEKYEIPISNTAKGFDQHQCSQTPVNTSSDPIPLFSTNAALSSSSSQPIFRSSNVKNEMPRTLRGRPVFDPSTMQIPNMGMDPTASPSKESLPPPPVMTNVKFNKKPF